MNIVILAAGMGTRMRSDLPKVLHPVAGKPLLRHVLDAAHSLKPGRLIVVHGYGGEKVRQAIEAPDGSQSATDGGPAIDWVLQSPQLGTGHAVAQAASLLADDQPTLVLYGDVPLVSPATLHRLREAAGDGSLLALLTQVMPDPSGLGRIVRDAGGSVVRIVEHKDADARTLLIQEINTGILIAPTLPLKRWLAALRNDNVQGEYYLTDIVAAAVADGIEVDAVHPGALWETLGVNSRTQLAEVERRYQLNQAFALTEAGVTLADPARLDIRGSLQCGRDVSIDVGCVFEGRVVLGDRVRIDANCVIRDAGIGDDAHILPMSHIDGARVGIRSRIGPFARLRPGTELGEDNHVGNFVEFKNARMADGSKANHLAYVGDADIGARVNIGAGTITCNYDGANKHKTVIEDDVFIGSDSQLVAPVTVRRGATLGAGTTLTTDAPAGALTISRARQTTITGWERPVKTRRAAPE
jgi:bifunctional UDP-N-acetylglucosamine pyrophosphorylase / glucosamine-1-phosphate N-acetyltransferase